MRVYVMPYVKNIPKSANRNTEIPSLPVKPSLVTYYDLLLWLIIELSWLT